MLWDPSRHRLPSGFFICCSVLNYSPLIVWRLHFRILCRIYVSGAIPEKHMRPPQRCLSVPALDDDRRARIQRHCSLNMKMIQACSEACTRNCIPYAELLLPLPIPAPFRSIRGVIRPFEACLESNSPKTCFITPAVGPEERLLTSRH